MENEREVQEMYIALKDLLFEMTGNYPVVHPDSPEMYMVRGQNGNLISFTIESWDSGDRIAYRVESDTTYAPFGGLWFSAEELRSALELATNVLKCQKKMNGPYS